MNKWLKVNDQIVNIDRINSIGIHRHESEAKMLVMGQYSKTHYIEIASADCISRAREIMKAIINDLTKNKITIIDIKKIVKITGGNIPE